MSQHVRVLVEAGLVETSGQGWQSPYPLRSAPLLLLADWLSDLILISTGAPLAPDAASSDANPRATASLAASV